MTEIIISHDDATVLRNTLLSSVTREFHDKEAVIWVVDIHMFRS